MDGLYRYRVSEVISVYDGDTCTLELDLGFHVKTVARVRLLGIDTPEIRGGTPESKAAGYAARDRLIDLISVVDEPLFIETEKDKTGKFGRWLGRIYVGDSEVSVNEILLQEGHAEPYPE